MDSCDILPSQERPAVDPRALAPRHSLGTHHETRIPRLRGSGIHSTTVIRAASPGHPQLDKIESRQNRTAIFSTKDARPSQHPHAHDVRAPEFLPKITDSIWPAAPAAHIRSGGRARFAVVNGPPRFWFVVELILAQGPPKLDLAVVTACRQDRSIARKRHSVDWGIVSLEGQEQLRGGRIPEANGLVVPGRSQRETVGTEGEAEHLARVAGQTAACFWPSTSQSAIIPPRCAAASVWPSGESANEYT